MNLRGVKRVGRQHWIITCSRWSRCYWGRYNQRGPRYAQALGPILTQKQWREKPYPASCRSEIWARHQDYNRPRKRIKGAKP